MERVKFVHKPALLKNIFVLLCFRFGYDTNVSSRIISLKVGKFTTLNFRNLTFNPTPRIWSYLFLSRGRKPKTHSSFVHLIQILL